jgi:ABC-type transport system substrate-binding protein
MSRGHCGDNDGPSGHSVMAKGKRYRLITGVIAVSLGLMLVVSTGAKVAVAASATPQRGGTLVLAGTGDIDFMYPPAGYNTTTHTEERAWTRQLFSYPASPVAKVVDNPVPDVAAVMPTTANGGITDGGSIYTIKLRSGVMWNTSPPRPVVAGDFVRAFRILCNPVAPVGAPGYFESTIVGMTAYCAQESKVAGTAAAIAKFVTTNDLSGVQAPNSSTLVFHLTHPTSDFLDIIAEPFASAVPVEYLKYVPNSAAFDAHTLSDGPYEISKYVPGSNITLVRNPVWKASSDPIRKAYVDKIVINEGETSEAVQQQIQTGTADMEWDIPPPTPDLPSLYGNPDFTVDSSGEVTYLIENLQSPNNAGSMKKVKVRQALQYAIDKTALGQLLGGPKIAYPVSQMLSTIDIGYKPFNLYPTPGNNGDPAKTKQLLAAAGYPHGLTLKLAYSNTGENGALAQSIQSDLKAAGVTVQLVPATQTNFNDKYVGSPSSARSGVWDLALSEWVPDWFGDNGRSVLEPMTDGPHYGPETVDYADYNSPVVNKLVAKALSLPASDEAQVAAAWNQVSMQTEKDSPYIPLVSQNVPLFTSSRVMNAVYLPINENFDITNIWLKGA